MLLKVVFVKFKISNNLRQNIDETHSKHPKIHRESIHLWILKISRKNSLAFRFLFFVISISGVVAAHPAA
jgi:hypothetical protein